MILVKMADTSSTHSSSSLSSLSSSHLSSSRSRDDFKDKSNEEIADEMACDMRNFLNFSVDREESKFNDSVEMMLTKLDEYFSLVDMIRSDTTLCLSTTIPHIEKQCSELEALFDKIDRLEAFVGMVKQNLAVTEELVNKADGDLGTVGGLVKKITSLVSMKRTTPNVSSSRPKSSEFTPHAIFSTADFFDHSTDQASSSPSQASASSS